MVMPGDNVQMTVVDLIAPIAMEDGLRFAIREGGRTVGAGVVAKIELNKKRQVFTYGRKEPFVFSAKGSYDPVREVLS